MHLAITQQTTPNWNYYFVFVEIIQTISIAMIFHQIYSSRKLSRTFMKGLKDVTNYGITEPKNKNAIRFRIS